MCKPSDPRCQGNRWSLAPGWFLHIIHGASQHLSVTRADITVFIHPGVVGIGYFYRFRLSLVVSLVIYGVVKSSNKCHMSKLSAAVCVM